MHCVGWNVVNVSWNDVGVLELDEVVLVWLGSLQRVSPELFLGLFDLVRYGMKYFNHQIPKSKSGIPSMREPASREIISASVELCETEVCFLHIQLIGTNV